MFSFRTKDLWNRAKNQWRAATTRRALSALSRAVAPVAETLEGRRLLSATFNGTSDDDIIIVDVIQISSNYYAQFTVDGFVQPLQQLGAPGLDSIAVDGKGGNDYIEIRSVVVSGWWFGLTGGDGNDMLADNSSNVFSTPNVFNGGSGDDTMRGSVGSDSFIGGFGTDTVTYSHRSGNLNIDVDGLYFYVQGSEQDAINDTEVVIGGSGNDTIVIHPSSTVNWTIDGGAGNDTITGAQGNDTITGGDGADSIHGGIGHDVIIGGDGNDVLTGANGNDWISGGDGTDTLNNGNGADTVFGDGGDDTLFHGAGADLLNGGSGIDTINFSNAGIVPALVDLTSTNPYAIVSGETDTLPGIDNVIGSAGNDIITGHEFGSVLNGGDGDDSLFGGSSADTLLGGNGSDWLEGGLGNDSLDGGAHADMLYFGGATNGVSVNLLTETSTGTGTDIVKNFENVHGSAFNDTIIGNTLGNYIYGWNGHDSLYGGDGNDTLEGGLGNDLLRGELGADYLNGNDGAASDDLDGGSGTDNGIWDTGDTVASIP